MFYNKQRGFGGVTMYMVIAMVVMGGLFGLYFKMSQDKIATLNQEVAVQKAGKESAADTPHLCILISSREQGCRWPKKTFLLEQKWRPEGRH